MATFKKTPKHMNLKDEEEKCNAELQQAQDSIYKRMAKQYGPEITPMRYLSKGKSGVHISLRMYETLYNDCETMKDNKDTPFRNMSEVYRAAMYLGILIFFHIYDNEYTDPEAKKLTKMIELSEKSNFAMFLNDDIVEQIQKIYNLIEKKGISHEKGIQWVKELVELIPAKDQVYCKQYAEKVFSGAKPIHVFEKSTKGRPYTRE